MDTSRGHLTLHEITVYDLPTVVEQFRTLHTMYDDDQARLELLTDDLVVKYLLYPGKECVTYVAHWRGPAPHPHSPSSSGEAEFEGLDTIPPAVPDTRLGVSVAGFIQVSVRENLPFNRPSIVGEVDNLFVDEQYRGESIGERLLAVGENWLRGRGVELVELFVHHHNTHAIGFYASHGYVQQHEVMRKGLTNVEASPEASGSEG